MLNFQLRKGRNRKSEVESRPPKQELSWYQLEFLLKSWRAEETYCYSEYREKTLVKNDVKKSYWSKSIKTNSKKRVFALHIVLIMMMMMSCRQYGYPWPSLATPPYHSSPPAGLRVYILCPHIVAVCKFELVVLLLHGHMWGSIGIHHLWARPCFSSSVPCNTLGKSMNLSIFSPVKDK